MGIPIWPFPDLNYIVLPPSVILLFLVLSPYPKNRHYRIWFIRIEVISPLIFIPWISTSHNMWFIVLTNKAATAISSAKAGLSYLLSKIPQNAWFLSMIPADHYYIFDNVSSILEGFDVPFSLCQMFLSYYHLFTLHRLIVIGLLRNPNSL